MIPGDKERINPGTVQRREFVVSKGGGVSVKGFTPKTTENDSLAEAYMAHIKLEYSAGGSSIVSMANGDAGGYTKHSCALTEICCPSGAMLWGHNIAWRCQSLLPRRRGGVPHQRPAASWI